MAMRGLTEFTMAELISNQVLINKTFESMYKQSKNHLESLSIQKVDYAEKSIEALRLLWNNFEDNHKLLMEAQLKEDEYFINDFFEKGKVLHVYVMTKLREFCQKSEENLGLPNETSEPSLIDELIMAQCNRFSKLQYTIENIDIDDIYKQDEMEEWQNKLKRMWNSIKDSDEEIEAQSRNSWPDVAYSLDFIRYKNMYDTTISLFNYKIDAIMYPAYCVIPHVGIPTWKMFDTQSSVHPFAVKSIAWANFTILGDLLRNNNEILEGDKRQLLVRTFLSYQTPSDPDVANRGAEEIENDRVEMIPERAEIENVD